MKRILLLVVALIVYGSFYPWRFQAVALPANPLWILLHSWPTEYDRFMFRDAVVNLALYAPFGALCMLAMSEFRSTGLRVIVVLLAAAGLSASVEMAQLFAVQRVCSLFDVTCNVAGAGIGILLAATFPAAISRALLDTETAGVFRLSGVVALLYLWAGYQLFPFFPALSQSALRPKLALLWNPETWRPREFFEGLAGWLAASALLERLVGRRILKALALALLVIPLKLFITDRSMSVPEAGGALAGAGVWLRLRFLPRPRLAAGGIVVAALVTAGLVPFAFSRAAQAFMWVPFLPMLQAPWQFAFLLLLQKSFLYGSAVWLVNEKGRGWLVSSMLVALPLAVVEGLQIFLPGRTPELTDPVLAMMMGFVLARLEQRPVALGRA